MLCDTLAQVKAAYAASPERAAETLAHGESSVPGDIPVVNLAAYTILGNLLLNLDEVLTKN